MGAGLRPAVFLDRDGVIVRLLIERGPRETPCTPDEVVLLPGAREALATLRQFGTPLIVVTNQPNVAKGKTTNADHAAVEERVGELLGPEAAVDAVYTCFHHPDPAQVVTPELCKACECRKPAPGLLLRAAVEHALDLRRSVMIGDSVTDIEAGKAAGCWTVRLAPRGGARGLDEPRADAEAPDLLAAVPQALHLLQQSTPAVRTHPLSSAP